MYMIKYFVNGELREVEHREGTTRSHRITLQPRIHPTVGKDAYFFNLPSGMHFVPHDAELCIVWVPGEEPKNDALSIEVRNGKPETAAQVGTDLHTEIEKLITEVVKTVQPHTNKIFLWCIFAIGVLTGATAQAITEALT